METEILRILLAEDDPADRLLFRNAFNEIDLHTELEIVNNGEELLNYLFADGNKLPHLLFLDLDMPKKNGMQCLKEIKNSLELKELFIAIFSSSANEQDVEDTFMNGANIYIQKPVDFEVLKEMLKKAVYSAQYYRSPPFNKANFLLRL